MSISHVYMTIPLPPPGPLPSPTSIVYVVYGYAACRQTAQTGHIACNRPRTAEAGWHRGVHVNCTKWTKLSGGVERVF